MRIVLYVFFSGLAVCCNMFLPDYALAWGPGVHMVTGNWLLQNLGALPADVAAVIMQHPGQFLHGMLSADIFIGKGCKAKKGHSHNWESGFSLLDRADSAQGRAYAYGYLAHLAADVVAHNVYVPGLFHVAPGQGKTAHLYLESQADRLLNWDSRDALGFFHEKESPAALAMLRHSMHRKALPFWINTRIFQGGIAVSGSRFWRESLRLLDGFFQAQVHNGLLDRMLAISTRAMLNLLRHGSGSPLLTFDPIGAEALSLAGSSARGPGPSADRLGKNLSQSALRAFERLLLRNAERSPSFFRKPCSRDAAELRVPVPGLLASLPPVCSPYGATHE